MTYFEMMEKEARRQGKRTDYSRERFSHVSEFGEKYTIIIPNK